MVPDPVRRQSLVRDLAELVAQRLRQLGVPEAAFECCLGLGDSMAEGSLEPAVVGILAPRLAGAAADCRRLIRRSRRLDFQIGPEQAPWRAMVPVLGRPPTKHEVTCIPCITIFERPPTNGITPKSRREADIAFCAASVCFVQCRFGPKRTVVWFEGRGLPLIATDSPVAVIAFGLAVCSGPVMAEKKHANANGGASRCRLWRDLIVLFRPPSFSCRAVPGLRRSSPCA
jgi:hypothetical protein